MLPFDLSAASQKLSSLALSFDADGLDIHFYWFRIMRQIGAWKITKHGHSSYEIHIIAKGTCRVTLEDGEFLAKEGELYVTPPGVLHEQTGIGVEEFMEFGINCDIKQKADCAEAEQTLLKILTETPCRPFEDSFGATNLFRMALEEAFYQRPGFFGNIKHVACLIIRNTARALAKELILPDTVPLKKRKEEFRFSEIERFISDNLTNPVSARDVAEYMHLSQRQVNRIVLNAKGVTTRDYISERKFEKAKELLKNTGLFIREISDKLGFSSEYYFNQFFKRMEGYPPAHFRKGTLMSENLKKKS